MQVQLWTWGHQTISEFLPREVFEVVCAPPVEHWPAQRKQLFTSQSWFKYLLSKLIASTRLKNRILYHCLKLTGFCDLLCYLPFNEFFLTNKWLLIVSNSVFSCAPTDLFLVLQGFIPIFSKIEELKIESVSARSRKWATMMIQKSWFY